MPSNVSGANDAASPTVAVRNDPPSEIFSNFTSFTLAPLTASDSAIPPSVVTTVQGHINTQLQPMLGAWNKTGAANGAAAAQSLIIEPVLTKIKYVSGAKRLLFGMMAGRSNLTMQVKFTQKETGKTIASPQFFSQSAAWTPTLAFGGADRAVFSDIVKLLNNYMAQNYSALNGGAG